MKRKSDIYKCEQTHELISQKLSVICVHEQLHTAWPEIADLNKTNQNNAK